MKERSLGQIGYDAYRDHTGGKSLATGAVIPEWDQLSEAIQTAWHVAASAIQYAANIGLDPQLP